MARRRRARTVENDGQVDRELTRGERAVAGVDRLNDMAAPFMAFARATMEAGRRMRERGRSNVRRDDAAKTDDAPTP